MMKKGDVKTNCYTPHPMCYWPSTDFDRVEIRQQVEMGPDISVKDEVLESEPGDMEDDEEGEGGDAASLDSTLKLLESKGK